MESQEHSPFVQVGAGPDGSVTYLVDAPPEALPPVRGRDLERAWYAAREAAIAGSWSTVRGFRFRRADGSHTDLALADPHARCWAGAVDLTVGLGNGYGLALCLRLLALVDLLAHARWALAFCRLERDGADLHPTLLRAAATSPLTAEARFDEMSFRACMALLPSPAAELAGARA